MRRIIYRLLTHQEVIGQTVRDKKNNTTNWVNGNCFNDYTNPISNGKTMNKRQTD